MESVLYQRRYNEFTQAQKIHNSVVLSNLRLCRQVQQLREVLSIVATVTNDQHAVNFIEECDLALQTLSKEEDKQFVKENIDFDFNIYFDDSVEIWIDTLRGLNFSDAHNKFLFLLEPEPISGLKQMYKSAFEYLQISILRLLLLQNHFYFYRALQQQQKFSQIFTWDTSILRECKHSTLFEHGGV
jgi:hypothetical protein